MAPFSQFSEPPGNSGRFTTNVGAGLSISGANAASVSGCTFIGNWDSGNTGGGIVLLNAGSDVTISDCVVVGNIAPAGGGIAIVNSSPTISGCIIASNVATGSGGGIRQITGGSPVLIDNVITLNVAGEHGGGMYSLESSPVVQNSIFAGNVCEDGGGGAIRSDDPGSVVIENSVFTGNTSSGWGGAINGSIAMANSTFVANSSGGNGGALTCASLISVSVSNAVLWDNSDWDDVDDEFAALGPTTVSYSDVQGGFTGTGNIDADPTFTGYPLETGSNWSAVSYNNATYQTVLTDSTATWTPGALAGLLVKPDADIDDRWAYVAGNTATEIHVWGDVTTFVAVGEAYEIYDLHLSAESPCIDAADGDAAPEFDLDGNPRVDDPDTTNTGVGTPPYADIGAYEYQP